MTRGLVDETGWCGRSTLLAKIRAVRGQAMIAAGGPGGLPVASASAPAAASRVRPAELPGPAGLGGNYPAPSAFPAPTGAPVRAPGAAGAPGADCYPVLRGRSQLETARGVGADAADWPARQHDARWSLRSTDAASGGGAGDAVPLPACPEPSRAAQGRPRDHRPAGRLRAAPAGHHRRAAARGRRWLDRRGQVDPGQLAGRAAGHRSRGDPADHPSAGAGAPQQRRPLVHRRSDPARAGPLHRGGTGLAVAAAGGRRLHPAGSGHARRPGHRLRGGGEPAARRPAAGRRRSLALRHLGRPLRRRRAVGLPARRRRAQRGRRGRAGPGAAAGDGGGAAAPRAS